MVCQSEVSDVLLSESEGVRLFFWRLRMLYLCHLKTSFSKVGWMCVVSIKRWCESDATRLIRAIHYDIFPNWSFCTACHTRKLILWVKIVREIHFNREKSGTFGSEAEGGCCLFLLSSFPAFLWCYLFKLQVVSYLFLALAVSDHMTTCEGEEAERQRRGLSQALEAFWYKKTWCIWNSLLDCNWLWR